ncbi:unnamed protein product [Paramecium octaurelia]|uniref:Uncharacterized protein n=1 Tax=Paramecium octaurelia TaxID=43137 RepID=A0A8S1XNI0_PAROT|nr:unnamed protein product [Paramecium octaurelia]
MMNQNKNTMTKLIRINNWIIKSKTRTSHQRLIGKAYVDPPKAQQHHQKQLL